MQFSLFYGGATNTKPNGTATLGEVVQLVKHNKEIKSLIEQIRKLKESGNDLKAAQIKTKLPYITPYGLFTERNNASLIEGSYNWLFAVDVDKKDNAGKDMGAIYTAVISMPSCILCFASPSGNGIKAFFKAPEGSFEIEKHLDIYKQIFAPYIELKCDCKIDLRQGVLSQPFFLTHDEHGFYNSEYTDLDLNFKQPLQTASGFGSSRLQSVTGSKNVAKNPNALLESLANKIQNRQDGKWEYFNKVAILAGGIYSGQGFGDLQKGDVLAALSDAARLNQFVVDVPHAIRQIYNGFEFGFKHPITPDKIEQRKGIDTVINQLDKTENEIQSDHVFNNNRFIRVGDDYYERIDSVSVYGSGLPVIEKRSRQTLIDDFGKGFLKEIPKFKSFCNVPSYENYQPVVNDCVNLFYPFIHEPVEGEFPTILKMFKHIFADQIEMGLDYVQILYSMPTQILPVLCLVSKENHTGKTSFLEFLEMLFKGNTAIISTADIEGDFNQHFISKQIIMVDESDLHKNQTASKIKQMATQKTTFVKGKFQQERKIDFFGKLILVSNDETGFLSIREDDIRYWVRKVPSLGSEFDADFNRKVEQELPGFVFNMFTRQLSTATKQSRAWFRTEDIETEATRIAKEANRSDCFFALFDVFVKFFEENLNETEIVATSLDIKINLLPNERYSNRYIAKTLQNEFKIDWKSFRGRCTFDSIMSIKAGKFYIIDKQELYSKYFGDIKDRIGNESDSKPENVLPFSGKDSGKDLRKDLRKDSDRDANGVLLEGLPF